jgi:hypothetical protein
MGKVISIEERRERKARLDEMKRLLKPILIRERIKQFEEQLLKNGVTPRKKNLIIKSHGLPSTEGKGVTLMPCPWVNL